MHRQIPAEDFVVRVVVIAADPLALAGLVSLLLAQSGCEVVAELPGWEELALYAAEADVVLWDTEGEGGRPDAPGDAPLPVLALLSAADNPTDLLAQGVQGVLERQADGRRLAAALAALVQGLVVLEPALVEGLATAEVEADEPLLEALTPREQEVLQLLAEGLSNKRIAKALDISEHTVKFHVNAILSKLGAATRTEAVMRAARSGWFVV